MAFKTAVEKLVLNNIELVVSTDNKLFVNDVKQADSNDVVSIDARVSLEESTEAAKVTSIDSRVEAEETTRSGNVTSIDSRVSLEESTEAAKVTSIDSRVQAEETTRSNNVTSIDSRVSLEESTEVAKVNSIDQRLGGEESATQVASIALAQDIESIEINFSSDLSMDAFDSAPAVAGMLRNSGDNPNIIIAMLAGSASQTGCKFVFSEGLTDGNYSLDVIVTD